MQKSATAEVRDDAAEDQSLGIPETVKRFLIKELKVFYGRLKGMDKRSSSQAKVYLSYARILYKKMESVFRY